MTKTLKEMTKLGFTLRDGFVYTRGKITINYGKGAARPWYAMNGSKTLCAHGDMLDSGPMRKFATPIAAAKAALKRWT